jgi:pyruvate/2-oxoglutarate dehydrogenase complex dihydrolipoamide dehydrogenase (E3) component
MEMAACIWPGPRPVPGGALPWWSAVGLAAPAPTPNTAGIGLEVAGVELDGRGYIKVNERLEVWAMGECAGSPQFTHVSFDDFRIV